MSLLGISFFSRVVGVKQYKPLHLVQALFWQKSCKKTMAISGSIVASGDLMVDTSVSSCGNLFAFVKPRGVIFGDGSYKLCRGAKISIRIGENESSRGGRGYSYEHRCNNFCLFHSSGLARGRAFSSSFYSDGVVPQASADGSLSSEQRPILAPSAQQSPIHSRLKLLSGACYLPHPAKEETGGEDAHFICADEQVIGVADGVGGWADVGVNAGEYARELMSNSAKAIREMVDGDIDPMQVLEKAHETTSAMGSSTACIIALKNQDLHAINLGDSGFIIVRDGSTIFESPVQQHGFNFTYQLERGNRADLPSSGQVFNIPVAPGDVVVAGSDGLFDNLYSKEIAAIVGNAVKEGLNPDATANKIAILARARALDREYQSPFSKAAREAGFSYCGGKLDDLTIVVSYVSAYADE